MKPRHVMHNGIQRLFFFETKLKVSLVFEWQGGVRSGKYVLTEAWERYVTSVNRPIWERFPNNWRLTKKDRNFIENQLKKEKEE